MGNIKSFTFTIMSRAYIFVLFIYNLEFTVIVYGLMGCGALLSPF